MKHLITFIMIIFVLFICINLKASPATSEMLDTEGCHVCQKACKRYGLEPGEMHCHIYNPKLKKIFAKANAYAATNSETMYALIVRSVFEYILTTPDKKSLIIGKSKKDISGLYKMENNDCGQGHNPLNISKGNTSGIKQIYGATLPSSHPALYTVLLFDKKYLVISIKNTDGNYLIVVDKDGSVVCSGNPMRGKLYLFCESGLGNKESVREGGYCRSMFSKQ